MSYEAYRSGSTEPWTVDVICAVIRAQKPRIVVETGTFLGLATAQFRDAMASYANEHESILHTVESDPERHRAVCEDTDLLRVPHPVSLKIHLVDSLEFLRSTGRRQVDVLFLDDDHEPQHVVEELQEASRVLRPGGVCFVHDVIGHFGLDEVVKSFGGIVLDLPRLHVAGGLGIISKA